MIRRATIIGVAGKFGVGKTTVASHVASALGFQYVRYSAVLETLQGQYDKRHLSLADFGHWATVHVGQETLTNLVLDRITGDAIIDGLRFVEDDATIRWRHGTHYRLIYLVVTDSQRRRQWMARTGLAEEDFERRNSHAVEQQVERLKQRADVLVAETDLRVVQTIVLHHISKWKLKDWGVS